MKKTLNLVDQLIEKLLLEQQWNKDSNTPRDYSKEYNAPGSKEQDERNKRKRDKRKYDKKHGECPEGEELHHVDGVESEDLRCEPISKNRGRKEKSRLKKGEIVIKIKRTKNEGSGRSIRAETLISPTDRAVGSHPRDMTPIARADVAGHAILDVAGVIPGIGEFADITNTIWYATEGEYLQASFSMISIIPVFGDIIGKGGKLALILHRLGKTGALEAAVPVARMIQKSKNPILKLFDKMSNHPKLTMFVLSMQKALAKFVDEVLIEPELTKIVNDLKKLTQTKPVEIIDQQPSGT